jgi:hypothetical protein
VIEAGSTVGEGQTLFVVLPAGRPRPAVLERLDDGGFQRVRHLERLQRQAHLVLPDPVPVVDRDDGILAGVDHVEPVAGHARGVIVRDEIDLRQALGIRSDADLLDQLEVLVVKADRRRGPFLVEIQVPDHVAVAQPVGRSLEHPDRHGHLALIVAVPGEAGELVGARDVQVVHEGADRVDGIELARSLSLPSERLDEGDALRTQIEDMHGYGILDDINAAIGNGEEEGIHHLRQLGDQLRVRRSGGKGQGRRDRKEARKPCPRNDHDPPPGTGAIRPLP